MKVPSPRLALALVLCGALVACRQTAEGPSTPSASSLVPPKFRPEVERIAALLTGTHVSGDGNCTFQAQRIWPMQGDAITLWVDLEGSAQIRQIWRLNERAGGTVQVRVHGPTDLLPGTLVGQGPEDVPELIDHGLTLLARGGAHEGGLLVRGDAVPPGAVEAIFVGEGRFILGIDGIDGNLSFEPNP